MNKQIIIVSTPTSSGNSLLVAAAIKRLEQSFGRAVRCVDELNMAIVPRRHGKSQVMRIVASHCRALEAIPCMKDIEYSDPRFNQKPFKSTYVKPVHNKSKRW